MFLFHWLFLFALVLLKRKAGFLLFPQHVLATAVPSHSLSSSNTTSFRFIYRTATRLVAPIATLRPLHRKSPLQTSRIACATEISAVLFWHFCAAMASTAPALMPVIASSDRSRDLEPYCQFLFSRELRKFIDIFPADFPQGDRHEEQEFLDGYFTCNEVHMQGGATGEGQGYRFLKNAWMWAAHWNLNCRVPAVAAHWISQNQMLVNDPEMKVRVFEPHVQPSTFFTLQEINMYGEKFLKVVVKCIQEELRITSSIPTQPPSPASAEGSGIAHDASKTGDAPRNTPKETDSAAQAQRSAEKASAQDADLYVKSSRTKAQAEVQQLSSSAINGGAQQQYQQQPNGVDEGGQQSTRGLRGSTSHEPTANRGTQAGGTPTYGRQDARYQSPSLQPYFHGSHGSSPFPSVPPMQSHTGSAGSFAPAHSEPTHLMRPSSQFAGQPSPIRPTTGQQLYGYPPQNNFQVQFQHHMPGATPMNFPPGFVPHHPQSFGDRSNFQSGGRGFGAESRLFDPEKQPKQPKHGSSCGSMRGNKNRGHSITRRSNNRGQIGFGQTGGSYMRDARPSNRQGGSIFHGSVSIGQVHADHRFNLPPQDRHWQSPYVMNENDMSAPVYEQMPPTTSGTLPPDSATDAQAHLPGKIDNVPSQSAQQVSVHFPRGHHQRVMSKAIPCGPTECNKYAIGEQCTYVKRMVIFQVPIEMSREVFVDHFSQYGTVEDVYLSRNHDASNAYPGLFHRGPSWVLFANADGAREVLKARGKPWAGGPVLFSEVAGEYWNPAIPQYHTDQLSYHRAASASGISLRNPDSSDGRPSRDIPSRDAWGSASGYDSQKKKGGSNNKRNKKLKKSGPNDNGFDIPSKVETLRQDDQEKHASPAGATSLKPPKSPTGRATARLPDAVADEVNIVSEASVAEGAVQSVATAIISAVDKPSSSLGAVDEAEDESRTVEQAVKLLQNVGRATAKPCNSHTDDGLHTAGITREDGNRTPSPTDATSAIATDQALIKSAEASAPMEIRERTESMSRTETTESIKSNSALTTVGGVTLATAQRPDDADTSAAIIKSSMTKIDAVTPERSVTIIASPKVGRPGAPIQKHEDEKVHIAQARSISGTSTSAFVTAPSTPAISAPELQGKSKKGWKSKGPAQTESLSLFAKSKSRKSSSKKLKHAGGPSRASSSADSVTSNLQLSRNATLHQDSHSGLAATSPSDNAHDKAETGSNVAERDGLGTSSASSQEPLSDSVWNVKSFTNTAKVFIGMTPSLSPVPRVLKPAGLSADHYLFPKKTREEPTPVSQPSEQEAEARKLNKLQDSAEFSEAELTTGLGIFDGFSDESKSKKRKGKSKAKVKKAKATASVTIASNITFTTKPNEPMHEFRGNDVNSDTSSQTFGRTSPTFTRPSMKQIDEAKQPKPLLEPRLSRQNRNKKHISVHSSSSKTDGTNSTDETAIATAESLAEAPPKLMLILTSCGDNTYMVSNVNSQVSGKSNNVKQEERSEPEKAAIMVDYRVLQPMTSPGTPKSIPTPEKPWDKAVADDAPSPGVEEARERIRQMDIEAAKKKKFA